MKNKKHYIVLRIEDNQLINSGFDYTDYLPQGNKPGKWTPKIPAAKIEDSHYKVSTNWIFALCGEILEEARIFEVDVKWQSIGCTVGYYTNKIGELIEVEPCPVCGCDPELRVDLETNKFYTTDPSSMIPWDAEISKVDTERREEWFKDTELFNTPEAALAAWNAEGKKYGRKAK